MHRTPYIKRNVLALQRGSVIGFHRIPAVVLPAAPAQRFGLEGDRDAFAGM
jgi:hypothetical protein